MCMSCHFQPWLVQVLSDAGTEFPVAARGRTSRFAVPILTSRLDQFMDEHRVDVTPKNDFRWLVLEHMALTSCWLIEHFRKHVPANVNDIGFSCCASNHIRVLQVIFGNYLRPVFPEIWSWVQSNSRPMTRCSGNRIGRFEHHQTSHRKDLTSQCPPRQVARRCCGLALHVCPASDFRNYFRK